MSRRTEVNDRDDGCHVHPACLTCPLPECIYDANLGRGKPRNPERDAAILQLARTGISNRAIARALNIAPHTVGDTLRRPELASAR